jgi:hypothetical protein
VSAYLLAWLLCAASGASCMLALAAPRIPGRFGSGAGYGLVCGLLLAAAATASSARADTAHAWQHAAPLLVAVGFAAGVAAAWRQWRARNAPRIDVDDNVDYWKTILIALALASLVWRGSWLASEVLLRPTYPWDAWDAWALKSKTWYLLGHYVPFAAPADWLAAGADLRSGPAWAYPSALGWMQVYFASAAGDWVEPLVNLPWVVLWVALLLGHYGQWRALGLGRPRAAIALFALGSLPLLETHVALAGYADLWVATLFGFALLSWLRWQERRERDQLALAVLCAAVLPLIKLEGTVWCASLLGAIGFGLLPRRWRWRAAAGVAIVLAAVVLVGQAQVLFAAIGWVRGGTHAIEIPVIGTLSLRWHGDAALGLAGGLFVQSNWHLLWWIAPAAIAWRWRALRQSDALSLAALLLAACFALLVVLFVFTDAAEWAESYTAVNRLVMHVTPAVVTLLALLMREPELFRPVRDTAPPSVPQTGPA